jgi:hypothetical protein
MLINTGAECCSHLMFMSEYAASSVKHIVECAERIKTATDTLPADLKPTGEVLTDISMRVLIETYVESLKLFSELGVQKIVETAITPEQYTEPNLLQRSGSDAL